MIINYEFGGDDDHAGDDWEFEVSYDMRIEAIADYFADDYINHTVKTTKASQEQEQKLRSSKKVIKDLLSYVLKDGDLITDEIEEDFRDVIEEYWEDEAYEEWDSNR